MILYFLPLIFAIGSIDSTHHLHPLAPIVIDPNQYSKSDLMLHDYRHEFHPTYAYHCLLQTESKYVYLNPTCQLLTRTSLKQLCSFEHRLKLEIVFPQNTSIFEIVIRSNRTDCQPTEENFCQFEKNPYRMKLKENEIYRNFLQLKTFASCLSSNYSLSSTNAKKNVDYFSLNSSTGYLSLRRALDYESTTTWKLVIQAHDQYHIPFYTYVIIDVDDVNDCPPLLSWNFPLQTVEIINDTDSFNIEISVDESKVAHKNVIIANLVASDLDSSPKFDLKINGSEFLPFDIDGPYGDSTFVLSTADQLDRENLDEYTLNLIVSDYGQPMLTSLYRLLIHIVDTNDNAPKFEQEIYFVDIQENNAVNTTLIQIFANDTDLGENGRVTYELNDQPSKEYLSIDNQTGVVRTSRQFDYEQVKNFTFVVTARDHPIKGPALKSTALVAVHIVDHNDNIPKFTQSKYEFSIAENNVPHTYLGQVFASDHDGSALTYKLDKPSEEVASLFYLSPSEGKIYVLNSLDRERADRYVFYMTASDGHHTSSRTEVQVNILDLNDEIPRFRFPTEDNDTLIVDRTLWNTNDFICQIDIQDNDRLPNHSLLLIYRFDQLKNYDYLIHDKDTFQFDSARFFLDQQDRLFFNGTNGTKLDEGVYYLAFKIVDGKNYFDEKLLKLIVADNVKRVESVIKQFDYLGLHVNNRFAYLQYHKSQAHHASPFDSSNRFLLLVLFAILIIVLIGIIFIFVSLLRCKTNHDKDLDKTHESILSKSQELSDSSSINLFKLSMNDQSNPNLRVTNCYDFNDSSLLMLSKDLMASSSLINEADGYHRDRDKTYTSWISSTSNRPDCHYSQRSPDASTFHSFNCLSLAPSSLSHELCPPKGHAGLQSSSEYTIAVVSSAPHHSPHTPVSSDDGFCGSSDTSDPSLSNAMNHVSSSSSYRQPYAMMKDGILNKSPYSPSFTSLSSHNATDTIRRVRFNLESDQRTLMSSKHAVDHGLRRFEQMYMNAEKNFDRPPMNSTIV